MSTIPTTPSLFIKDFLANREDFLKKIPASSLVNQKNKFPLPPSSSMKKWELLNRKKEVSKDIKREVKKDIKQNSLPKKDMKPLDAKKKFIRAQQILNSF